MANQLPFTKEAVLSRLRQLERSQARGGGPFDLNDCFGPLKEKLALKKLLRGEPDAVEVAEILAPGIIDHLTRFAMEGGR